MGRTVKIALVAVLAGLLAALALATLVPPPSAPVRQGAGAEALPAGETIPDRCRSVIAPDRECDAAWAASRRRFFGQQDRQP